MKRLTKPERSKQSHSTFISTDKTSTDNTVILPQVCVQSGHILYSHCTKFSKWEKGDMVEIKIDERDDSNLIILGSPYDAI